jgi:ADP-ribose pyrophosphatase YjhB (NUDIX family)
VGVGAVILVPRAQASSLGQGDAAPETGVVLVKRRFEPLAGRWSLPGGALEVGETLEAGIAREVVEETGLTIEVGPIVDVFDRILLDPDGRIQYHFVLIDYLCRPLGGQLLAGSDVADAVLADPDRLEPFGMTKKATDVIRKAIKHVV